MITFADVTVQMRFESYRVFITRRSISESGELVTCCRTYWLSALSAARRSRT